MKRTEMNAIQITAVQPTSLYRLPRFPSPADEQQRPEHGHRRVVEERPLELVGVPGHAVRPRRKDEEDRDERDPDHRRPADELVPLAEVPLARRRAAASRARPPASS